MRNDLSADYVRSLLDYDPKTGAVSWKQNLNRRGHFRGPAGTINRSGYLQIGINNKLYLAHRLVWLHFYGRWPRQFLDHANGNRSDNRIENLREASRLDNNRNKATPSNNRSGFKGVVVRQSGRISAHIGQSGKQRHLGYFSTLEGAHAAYQIEARKSFGQFYRDDTLASAEAQLAAARQILEGK
jgi:hypothetical protein